ncbi:MAG TPA: DNA-directed RNA polymerase subunit beta, partial [Gemmatimonadales bacterium]|nr:DNA-directed RNA polymerase subunit beta [Gemmatimonadales bacterium]
RINELGVIETPYRVVKNGKVTNDVKWLSASDEEGYNIAQANAPLDETGKFDEALVLCRKGDDYPLLPPERIDFMDVAPEQLVSIAAALIPFLEHDDANRALMGSNMQRQSVPLLFPQAPLVGTGLEEKVARDSGAVIAARRAGTVTRVTADEIIVDAGENGVRMGETPLARLTQHDRYRVKKFWRTNQDTAINQRPLVAVGQKVDAGEIIADGPATDHGELALGANVVVAFMPWYGHNFEDAIVLSERLVKDDVYSSIHIQELELHVRDTKRGQEEITREIPNGSDESLVDLDERGIVRIGAHVKPGDILVGKITPKGETELSPEEKLLTAIFGEKAKDVKDSSLKVPPGLEGVVIDVKIFSRIDDQVIEKDRGERIGEVRRLEAEEKLRVNEVRDGELMEMLEGQTVTLALKSGTVEEAIPAGTKLDADALRELKIASLDLKTFRVENKKTNERIREVIEAANNEKARIEEKAEERIDKILQPDELPPGVIQLVKVYLAEKRKISVGDKMAGRHGNKGIVARVVPEEDMPFLPDGRPVDIVLNPLGVPSRMNIGQVLETHLGWVAKTGWKVEGDDTDWRRALRAIGAQEASPDTNVATPVFDGAKEEEITGLLSSTLPNRDGVQLVGASGKAIMFDGRTGEPLPDPIAVGYIYILKLNHLVDDKIHARSTGPYSMITQQPLGGKAQFGGQRFGEMECWAMQAYGAAYALQE